MDDNQASFPRHTVEFSGKADEYFSIWIVNILLSVVTLGIYSAWAKVRTLRYFYGHTRVDGHGFHYLAKPMQILKGRLLAVAFFALYSVLSATTPVLGGLMMLAMVFLFPWIINQGMRFHMRMIQHRNVRFSFAGSYGEALVNFILLPVASLFTFYLMLPWVLKRIDEYLHSNIRYGGKPLEVKLLTSNYYVAALTAIAVSMIAFFILALLAGLGFGGLTLAGADTQSGAMPVVMGVLFAAFYFVAVALVSAIYQAMIRNHLVSSCRFDNVAEFESDLKVVDYTLLILSNTIAIVCTLGLAYPWAKIRKTALLADATHVTLMPGINELTDQQDEQTGAFGEEAANVFDIDISLG